MLFRVLLFSAVLALTFGVDFAEIKARKSKGLSIMNCTHEARYALKSRFVHTPFAGDGSICASLSFFFAALFRADHEPTDKLLVTVGANKGYDVVNFLSLWGTQDSNVLTFGNWAKLLSKMHNQGREVDDWTCGACKECQEKIRVQPEYLPERSVPVAPPLEKKRKRRDGGSFTHTHLVFPFVIALDSNPRNTHSLRRIQTSYSLSLMPLTAVVTNATEPEELLVPSCPWGDEECAQTSNNNNNTATGGTANVDQPEPDFPVRQLTLSSLIHELQVNGTLSTRKDISILRIRANGREPLVLLGAKELFRSGRIRLVIFSYSPSLWPSDEALHEYVDMLSSPLTMNAPHGGACYLLGNTRTWKLTSGCWDGIYHKHPATIACVKAGDPWETALDGVAVRHRRIAMPYSRGSG